MIWPLVLLGVALLTLLLFAYPYAIYPMILRGLRTRPLKASMTTTTGAEYAILFCAYNEVSTAPAKMENLAGLKSRYPDIKILIYDDGSTDGCAEVYGERPDLAELIPGPGRSGKAAGMKRLVAIADRPILVFTDANVMLDPGALDALQNAFSDPQVGGVCGHLEYGFNRGTATEHVGHAYWGLDEALKAEESRTGNVMGGDGSIFAVRRYLYPDFPDTVQDDFTVSMSVVYAGLRLIYDPAVIAYEQLVSSSRDEYSRKVRIAARAFHTYSSMRTSVRAMSALDRWKFFSHKQMRWHGALFLLIAGLAAIAAAALFSWWFAILLTAVASIALFVLPRIWGPAASIREMLLAVAATFQGVVVARRGRTFATWTPPTSR
ncbi:glycosyltransferase [Microbacterium sp. USHLN272]|uniref:glycosyltransferase n=1 Tax=Microbacterium sp. USHLN272 TaxID=3081287 RepID=UPI00301A9CE0